MDTTSPDSQALPPGTHLHEFVIERVLGTGGFGITYLARDTSLNRQVVIKENLPSQFAWRETATGTVRPRHTSGGDIEDYEWSMRNFLREADTLASLDHPGIVRVMRKFESNGTAYFVMPFVEGIAFDQLITQRQEKNQPFTEEELRGLLERMLDALGYLHDHGIYHRDIKPANILITMRGIPVLIDFGSARQRLSERSMTVIESAGFTPFEQLQSRGNVGPWSDLYALGGTLEKAITGHAPPKAMDRMRHDPRIRLAERPEMQGHYSSDFIGTIDKALELGESARWQNADEWQKGLHGRARLRLQIPTIQSPELHEGIAFVAQSEASAPQVRMDSTKHTPRTVLRVGICLFATLLTLIIIFSGKQGGRHNSKTDSKLPSADVITEGNVPDALAPGPLEEVKAIQEVGAPSGGELGEQTLKLTSGQNLGPALAVLPDDQSPPEPPQVISFPENSFFKMTHSNDVLYVGRRGGKSICTFEALQAMPDNVTLVLVMTTRDDPYAGSPGDVVVRSPENGPELARLKGVSRTRTYRIPISIKATGKIVISIESQHNDGMKLKSFLENTPDLYLEPGVKP